MWSIPKGIHDDNDIDLFQTAVRELYEETGLKLKRTNLTYIGNFYYTSMKDFALFSYKEKNMKVIDIDKMRCSSYYINAYNQKTISRS